MNIVFICYYFTVEADWACIKEVALSTSFNKCILREEKAHGRNGTIPMCR